MFENEETYKVLKEKVMPALEELARAEFGTFSMTGNIDAETVAWMKKSKRRMKGFIGTYLEGLMETQIALGKQLKQFCGDLNDSGD